MMNRGVRHSRITGSGKMPYEWMDRPPRRPNRQPQQSVRRGVPEMRERREDKYKRSVDFLNKATMYTTFVLIVMMLCLWIYEVIEVRSQRMRINAIYEVNKTFNAEIEGLEVQLCMETRPMIIKQKARTMGMVTPAENEVCVLRSVVRRTMDTAQTAESMTRGR